MSGETAPDRTASGEPVPELLAEVKRPRGRPKGNKSDTDAARERKNAKDRERRAGKAKAERRPKREPKRISRADYERYARLGVRALLGRSRVSVFEIGELFGMVDMRKSAEYKALSPEDRASVDEQIAQYEETFANVLTRARAWCPEEDRFEDDETDLLARMLAMQSGRVNKATGEAMTVIDGVLRPFRPIVQAVQREGQTAAIVAALAIPRLARRGMLPALFSRLVYGPVRMAAGGARRRGGADGLGEEHARGDGPAADAPVHAGAPDETGQGEVRGASGSPSSERNGRSGW